MGGRASRVQLGSRQLAIVRKVAEGGFGFVYIVKDVSSGASRQTRQFALKHVLAQSEEQLVAARREIAVMEALEGRSPHLMPLLAHRIVADERLEDTHNVYLLFPLAVASVQDLLEDSSRVGKLTEEYCLLLASQMCSALAAMHGAGWAHRDVKPANIMLRIVEGAEEDSSAASSGAPPLQAVLIDFGSAAPLQTRVSSRAEALQVQDDAAENCSAPYRAPELYDVASDCVLDGRVDVWSLGCTLYAMAFGRSPFDDPRDGVLTLAIRSGRFNVPVDRSYLGRSFSRQFVALIRFLLNPDPAARPTLEVAHEGITCVLEGRPLPEVAAGDDSAGGSGTGGAAAGGAADGADASSSASSLPDEEIRRAISSSSFDFGSFQEASPLSPAAVDGIATAGADTGFSADDVGEWAPVEDVLCAPSPMAASTHSVTTGSDLKFDWDDTSVSDVAAEPDFGGWMSADEAASADGESSEAGVPVAAKGIAIEDGKVAVSAFSDVGEGSEAGDESEEAGSEELHAGEDAADVECVGAAVEEEEVD
eukprot:PLAT11959.1.p1 GENE.PLAT11959.1~~PLAT11959.1.p1  ORF type:complete len:536 (+),score=101.31 PLAT11959.1:1-1608(+)